jgi:murein DD-endopeptidase MepM/ murein hydrolase activator NlpD
VRKEHSAKKLLLITVLGTLSLYIMISIAMAVQLPWKQGGSKSAADIDGTGTTITAMVENSETIDPAASQQVIEEDAAVPTINPSSSGNTVQDVKADTPSRGAKTTPAVLSPGGNSRNFWQSRSTWLQPLKGLQTADPTGGARYFGASRANGRAHAAIDFIAPNGRLVYAMTDGKVIRTSLFFQNTSAVEVQNTDGTIARYCEIAPAVSFNTIVHRGDVIGKVITNNAGTSMLHLEMYMGTATGKLSQSNTSITSM